MFMIPTRENNYQLVVNITYLIVPGIFRTIKTMVDLCDDKSDVVTSIVFNAQHFLEDLDLNDTLSRLKVRLRWSKSSFTTN